MSMFKTLQRLPGVITIFHDPHVVSSSKLVSEARKLILAGVKDKDDGLKLDVTEANPTNDQLVAIRNWYHELKAKQPSELPRPTLVDWFSGEVSVQDDKAALDIVKRAVDSGRK